jgi:hypothetical protein
VRQAVIRRDASNKCRFKLALLQVEAVSSYLALFSQNPVHSSVVTDHNVVLHVCLGSTQTELYEANLSILNTCRASCCLLNALLKDKTINKLSVIDCATQLLADLCVQCVYSSA